MVKCTCVSLFSGLIGLFATVCLASLVAVPNTDGPVTIAAASQSRNIGSEAQAPRRRAVPGENYKTLAAQDNPLQPKTKQLCADDAAALELGRKVLAAHSAIRNPTAPNALSSITALGLDSRYYVMVRGWLTQQLEGDMSILSAQGENTPNAIRDRIQFLKDALRAIDLE